MDHNLLVSELQSLVVESKRRNPEVREAGENALEILKGGPVTRDVIGKHADKLLAPVTLGCKTKVGKIIGISIAALQRLVALGGVPTAALPEVLSTLNSVAGQAVDIQLKILQTLLSVLTHHADVHDEVLGNALLLCFKLQDSRVSVVSSTAAATLRQAVMVVFDRISSDTSTPSIPLVLPTDPPTELKVSPSALDAFNLFSDLCILTAGSSGGFSLWGSGKDEKPKLLKLSSLQRTFGLELVESVLSGYEEAVKKRPELVFLLKNSLDPLLIKLLHDRPSFPIALRVCRLQFLLIRSFVSQLPAQVEGYLLNLIRIGTGEGETEETKKEHVPSWLRVLALEIFRGICGDGAQLRNIWKHFDQPDGPQLFGKIVAALGRLLNEKPILLGVGSQMNGIGVSAAEGANVHAGYLDMGIGIMASAATAGITTVGSMMGSGQGGLGAHSGMRLRLIEQHDKAEAPAIPETYIYLLALQSLDAVAETIYVAAGQSPEPQDAIRGMAESAWPALLAALSFGMGTNLSDGLFAEVLSALQDFTVACGLLGLQTPRDAFLNTLGKYAVPPPAVSAMQSYMDAPMTLRNNSVISVDNLGLGALGVGATPGPPSLSERNLACLRSMVLTARILSSSLGEAWHDVLETLQNANFMLGAKRPNTARRPTNASPQIGSPQLKSRPSMDSGEPRPDLFDDLDTESIQGAINILFDGSRDLDDGAFTTFISALCRLSSEMIGMDFTSHPIEHTDEPALPPSSMRLSPGGGKRRTSGINVSGRIQSGERSFSLTRLRVVATTNLPRIVNRDPSVGWNCITRHLLAVARHVSAPTTLRMQASDTLSELLLGSIRLGKESRIQHQVFDVLVRQVDVYPISHSISTDHDVRASGYQTLNQILESSGHALEVGWQTIFGMLNNVCKDREPVAMARSDSSISLSSTHARPSTLSRSDANLVRIAFPSLSLICTDFLSSLDSASMRLCIACLGCFGRQKEDVNITLAAIGLLWNVSDAVQGTDKDLWLYLLTELLELGRDARLEVRSSAMQTLFRCIDLYGAGLSDKLWEDVFWKIVSPLLDAGSGDESSVLALTSVGSIFWAFLPSLAKLGSFERIYGRLLERVELAWKRENSKCCSAALKALEKAITADQGGLSIDQSAYMLDATWSTFTRLAGMLDENTYSQENLVDLVRIAKILHDKMQWETEKVKTLSNILRGVMTYDRSPEYRPDNDNLAPLQNSIASLVGDSNDSTKLGDSVVLGDLAEWTSLAYIAPTPKVTYVGLTKWGMPKIRDVFGRVGDNEELYRDGTVETVLGAYALPIKMKYDCPPANRFGDDPPLWRTALANFLPILEHAVTVLDKLTLSAEGSEGIWAQIIDIFAGVLLADSSPDTGDEDESFVLPLLNRYHTAISPRLNAIPERLIELYAEVLRKASILYHFDVGQYAGTTAPAIADRSERTRYWAFDALIKHSARPAVQAGLEQGGSDAGSGKNVVAAKATGSLIKRIEGSLRGYIEDARLRGQMPLGRVREEELLFILRHLATLRLHPGTLLLSGNGKFDTAVKDSERAHLFLFYPLLIEVAFLPGHIPSMWMFPDEYAQIYAVEAAKTAVVANGVEEELHSVDGDGTTRDAVVQDETVDGDEAIDAGDGGDLIEVSARDLARQCLEIVGMEIGLGLGLGLGGVDGR